MVVGFAAVCTLAITGTLTSTLTGVGTGATVAVDTIDGTVNTVVSVTVVSSWVDATGALAVGLGRATQCGTAVVLVIDFKVADGWITLTTEVIVTSGAASHATLVGMTQVAVRVLTNVCGVSCGKVVSTAPGWAIAVAIVLVVATANVGVFVVIG